MIKFSLPPAIVVQFAYCYPYTYSNLQLYLEGVERLRLDYCSRELLCLSVVSWYLTQSWLPYPPPSLPLPPSPSLSFFLSPLQQQRRLDLLTITSPNNLESGTRRKMVFITARVHPGESPSSYVCQGMIYQS